MATNGQKRSQTGITLAINGQKHNHKTKPTTKQKVRSRNDHSPKRPQIEHKILSKHMCWIYIDGKSIMYFFEMLSNESYVVDGLGMRILFSRRVRVPCNIQGYYVAWSFRLMAFSNCGRFGSWLALPVAAFFFRFIANLTVLSVSSQEKKKKLLIENQTNFIILVPSRVCSKFK